MHVNDVLGGTSALSYAVIVNSPLSMIQLLLDRDADVQDAHLFAIHYDRRTLLPVLLDSLNSKNGPTAEYRVVTKSYRFAPYSTPILVAAKNNNRYMISFLRHRKHELARPHKAACSCAQCDLSAGPGQRRKLQELLDTYSALTAPMYLHQCEQNVLGACFVYGRSVDQTLLHLRFVSLPADVEQSFGQLLLSIEAHACSLIQNVRTDKQMQFLMQSDIEEYPNNSVNYPVSLQLIYYLIYMRLFHKSKTIHMTALAMLDRTRLERVFTQECDSRISEFGMGRYQGA